MHRPSLSIKIILIGLLLILGLSSCRQKDGDGLRGSEYLTISEARVIGSYVVGSQLKGEYSFDFFSIYDESEIKREFFWYHDGSGDTILSTSQTYHLSGQDLGRQLVFTVRLSMGKKLVDTLSYRIIGTIEPDSEAVPTASQEGITGNCKEGETLRGSYVYHHNGGFPEDDSEYRWYYSDDLDTVLAVTITYELTADDLDKKLIFEVTPNSETQLGEAVRSAPSCTVQAAPAPFDAAYSLRQVESSYNGPAIRVRRSSDNQAGDIVFDGAGNLNLSQLYQHLLTMPLAGDDDAKAAFSLRKINPDYTGFSIRVRESDRNREANIGFTDKGELDQEALLAHVGLNDGFVTVVYDQSGSGFNAMQTDMGRQSRIVNSGSIYKINNRPAIYTENGEFYNVMGDMEWTETTPTRWVFGVFQPDANVDSSELFGTDTQNMVDFGNFSGTSLIRLRNRTGAIEYSLVLESFPGDQQAQLSLKGGNSEVEVYRNGTELTSISSASGESERAFSWDASTSAADANHRVLRIMGADDGSNERHFVGYFQELVFFNNDKTELQRTTIESSQMSYWFNEPVSGYISTWYDQSGNGNHMTQPLQPNQPVIVLNDTLHMVDGKVAIHKKNTHFMNLPQNTAGTISLFAVAKPISNGAAIASSFISNTVEGVDEGILWNLQSLGTGNPNWGFSQSNTSSNCYVNSVATTHYSLNDSHVFSCVTDGISPVGGDLRLGQNSDGSGSGEFFVQEIVMIDEDKTADRQSIETLQKDYWIQSVSIADAPLLAYSITEKLIDSYSGPAIRVRRGADDQEQDIGFDDDGNLDITSLYLSPGMLGATYATNENSSTNGVTLPGRTINDGQRDWTQFVFNFSLQIAAADEGLILEKGGLSWDIAFWIDDQGRFVVRGGDGTVSTGDSVANIEISATPYIGKTVDIQISGSVSGGFMKMEIREKGQISYTEVGLTLFDPVVSNFFFSGWGTGAYLSDTPAAVNSQRLDAPTVRSPGVVAKSNLYWTANILDDDSGAIETYASLDEVPVDDIFVMTLFNQGEKGNTNNFVQTDLSAQARIVQNGTYLGSADFDGVDDCYTMEGGLPELDGLSEMTLHSTVMSRDTSVDNDFFGINFDGNVVVMWYNIVGDAANNVFSFLAGGVWEDDRIEGEANSTNQNQWQNITGLMDSDQRSIWIDGLHHAVRIATTTSFDLSGAVTLGCWPHRNSSLEGGIKNFLLYDRELGQESVEQLHRLW